MPESKLKVSNRWPPHTLEDEARKILAASKTMPQDGLHRAAQGFHEHVHHEDHVFRMHAPDEQHMSHPQGVEHVDHVQHVDHIKLVDHLKHVDHVVIEEHTQSDFIAELAHVFALTALLLYAYTLIGCYIFKPSFIRQLAYILQTIRLSLTLATLLPCVLHWQAYQIFPIIPAQIFPFVIVALLVLNILVATGLRLLTAFLCERYQRYSITCACKCQKPQGKPCCLMSLFGKGDCGKSKKKCQ